MNDTPKCTWRYERLSMFETSCKQSFLIDPAELLDTYRFCPFCGGRITEYEPPNVGPENDTVEDEEMRNL